MGLLATLTTTLTTDSTLMALLTGGVFNMAVSGEISRQNTAGAFDATTKEIKPCALLKIENDAEIPPFDASTRTMVTIYLYQRFGYDVVDPAADRIYALLHRKKLAAMWEMRHADDVPHQEDQALAASLMVCRYQVVRNRA